MYWNRIITEIVMQTQNLEDENVDKNHTESFFESLTIN